MFSPIDCGPISIREFQESDLITFTEYRSVPEIARYQSWTTYSYEDAVRLYSSMKEYSFGTLGKWFQLAIADPSTNQLFGDLAVHFLDEDQMEIGFTMSPNHQGKGYATLALRHMVNYLFVELKKHRIVATTDVENEASCRLLERVGFRKEAHFIQNIFFRGSWGSEYLYALLASEWNPI